MMVPAGSGSYVTLELSVLTSSAPIWPVIVASPFWIRHSRKRTGDVAVLVEADQADDAFVLDRLAGLDVAERDGAFGVVGEAHPALQ